MGGIVGYRLSEFGRTWGLASAGPWQGVHGVFLGVSDPLWGVSDLLGGERPPRVRATPSRG